MKAYILGLSLVLIIVSALNHGSIALFGVDFIAALFGFSPLLIRILYALVGVAGVYLAIMMNSFIAFFKIKY